MHEVEIKYSLVSFSIRLF